MRELFFWTGAMLSGAFVCGFLKYGPTFASELRRSLNLSTGEAVLAGLVVFVVLMVLEDKTDDRYELDPASGSLLEVRSCLSSGSRKVVCRKEDVAFIAVAARPVVDACHCFVWEYRVAFVRRDGTSIEVGQYRSHDKDAYRKASVAAQRAADVTLSRVITGPECHRSRIAVDESGSPCVSYSPAWPIPTWVLGSAGLSLLWLAWLVRQIGR